MEFGATVEAPMSRFKHAPVHFADSRGHEFVPELRGEAGPSVFAKPPAECFILCKSQHGVRERGNVAGLDEQSGFFVKADFGSSVDRKRDDRLSCDQSLRQYASQSFPVARMDDCVHRVNVVRDIIRRHQAGESKMIGQPEFRDSPLKPLFQNPVTDEHKPHIRNYAHDCRSGLNQVLVPLEMKQASHFSEDDVGGSNVERCTNICG